MPIARAGRTLERDQPEVVAQVIGEVRAAAGALDGEPGVVVAHHRELGLAARERDGAARIPADLARRDVAPPQRVEYPPERDERQTAIDAGAGVVVEAAQARYRVERKRRHDPQPGRPDRVRVTQPLQRPRRERAETG